MTKVRNFDPLGICDIVSQIRS